MTALDLDALLALREQATGGEWYAERAAIYDEDGGGVVAGCDTDDATAVYIAALHNAAPELVAKAREADRLRVQADNDEKVMCNLNAEVGRLRAWKAEAIEVIEGWEAVWEALGRPGTPGQSKSAAVLAVLSPSDGGDQ